MFYYIYRILIFESDLNFSVSFLGFVFLWFRFLIQPYPNKCRNPCLTYY
uniref:Uncharacterized protein n=1 Tax=Rhizophora mucronata TaxID=61149 RepID=A0A2P2QGA6_RHIMU